MSSHSELRRKGLEDLKSSEILLLDGHFNYGNGYHGRVYLNPHQLFRQPSTSWRFAQDLIDVIPGDLVQQAEVVAGPVTGGALLAHTVAGLLDSRRSLSHHPCLFAPFNYDPPDGFAMRDFYRRTIAGKRVLVVDDVRNTGKTFERCAALVKEAGGELIATAEILDRCEAIVDLGVPNISLADYRAPDNYPATDCPLCKAGVPISRF